ncbi:hypothetical protein D3C86_1963830 [compost metagenome]
MRGADDADDPALGGEVGLLGRDEVMRRAIGSEHAILEGRDRLRLEDFPVMRLHLPSGNRVQ